MGHRGEDAPPRPHRIRRVAKDPVGCHSRRWPASVSRSHSPASADVAGTVERLISESRLRERVPAGGTVAVGVGSRGISCIRTVARTAVDTLKEMGYRPFIVAAMGSHGGATAEGQRKILSGYGITPENMGVEVRTEMDSVVLGKSPVGLPIYFDRNAHEADGILLLNRVKSHTDFVATHESGVLKMLVIGLGKREGASQIHKLGLRGMQGEPAGRRQVPDREHEVRPRPGDRRERRGRAGRDRPAGARRRSSRSSRSCWRRPAR